MAKWCVFLSALAALGTAVASAQMSPPKPALELKRLDYFVGTWTLQADLKPSQFGPGGKMTETEINKWMEGEFFLLSHVEFKSSMGNGTGIAIMGYDPENKVYTFNAFNSWGEAEHSKGTLDGDTWTWLSDATIMAKPTKTRFTIKEVSADTYSTKFEMASDDGSWSRVMEGSAKRSK